jgi:ubiquinone/menaquinone biosynthesis C-methylase UbiE
MIKGASDVRDAYRDETVARDYIDERFREPLGALLHCRQVHLLQDVLRQRRPQRVLELAPGPARVTRDLSPDLGPMAVLVDASAQMLAEARARLRHVPTCRFIQGDAFQLPVTPGFDLVYTLRLIRHFELADRERIYRELSRILTRGGLLMFDAVNEAVAGPLRKGAAPGAYRHYDALLRPEELRQELDRCGFDVLALRGVQHRFTWLYQMQTLVGPRSRTLARWGMELFDRTGGEPLEWLVICQRR